MRFKGSLRLSSCCSIQHAGRRGSSGTATHEEMSFLSLSLTLKTEREGEKKCHSPDRLDMLTLLWSEKQLPWQPLSNSGTGCLGELGKASLFVVVGRGFSLALCPSILWGNPPEDYLFSRPRHSANLAQEIPICSCSPPEIEPDPCKIAGGWRLVRRKREEAVRVSMEKVKRRKKG